MIASDLLLGVSCSEMAAGCHSDAFVIFGAGARSKNRNNLIYGSLGRVSPCTWNKFAEQPDGYEALAASVRDGIS